MKKVDNPLRIKVTGKCNRSCCFCHKEGGMDGIEDILPDQQLKELIEFVSAQLNISSIAITGGEPLTHPDLVHLAEFIHMQTDIKKIYMTTNGLIKRDFNFWKAMKENGLSKVNISIPDIITEYKRNEDIHQGIFLDQFDNIEKLNRLNIVVDINVVIFSDYLYTKFVIDTLKVFESQGYKFELYLLPNLLAGYYDKSLNIIEQICETLGYKEEDLCGYNGISNATKCFADQAGNRMFVKTTAPNKEIYHLPFICQKCEKKHLCREGFYGMRLEKRKGELYIRLCLLKSSPDVLIPFTEFKNSETLSALKKLWGTD